jgi:integrase
MASGCVTVQVIKARLRLVWSWQGRRFFLYIGLPETKPNRKAANIKAQTIELDITSGNFDQSLAKYKPQAQSEAISVVEMFSIYPAETAQNLDRPIGKISQFTEARLGLFQRQNQCICLRIYCRKVSSLFGAEA